METRREENEVEEERDNLLLLLLSVCALEKKSKTELQLPDQRNVFLSPQSSSGWSDFRDLSVNSA